MYARLLSSPGISGWERRRSRNYNDVQKFNAGLEGRIQVCCTPSMAEEKNKSKDIVLWIITVVLIAVAIFWYKK